MAKLVRNQPKVFSELEKLAALIPVRAFWVDTAGVFVGCNDLFIKLSGVKDRGSVIGVRTHDFYPHKFADILVKNTKKVIKEKKTLTFEESVPDRKTGKIHCFLTTKSPLFDASSKRVVGVVGASIELTDRKENERLRKEAELQKRKELRREAALQKEELRRQKNFEKLIEQAANDTISPLAVLLVLVQSCVGLPAKQVFETLKTLTASIPLNISWVDVNSAFVGMNQHFLANLGAKLTVRDFVGKSLYDLLPHKIVDSIIRHNNLVMKTGKILSQELPFIGPDGGDVKYFNRLKAPLYDDKGKTIGVLGVFIDTTLERNVERLRLENEKQKSRFEEQEKFHKTADRVIRGIRLPLINLLDILKACEHDLPEEKRIAMQAAAMSVGDITNNLLNEYFANDENGSKDDNEYNFCLPVLDLDSAS